MEVNKVKNCLLYKRNPTKTKKIAVITVTMKCTPDYPKYGDLNSLHVMDYYKNSGEMLR